MEAEMTEPPEFDADVWCPCNNELGEGPLAHPDRHSLIWFDILQRRIFERDFNGGEPRVHTLDVMPSAAGLIDDRRILVATEVDLRLFDLDTGAAQPLQPFLDRHDHLRSNDGRVHPSGAFWIGSMGKNAEPRAGAVWWFRAGDLRLLFDGITIPNSISFVPGGGAAYFADTPKGIIWRVAVDKDTGLPEGEPVEFVRFASGDGAPDGAVVDADGNLWVAAWGASAVHVFRPDGQRLSSYRLPVSQPTCPAFFGSRLDELAVTTAREKLIAEALAEEPQAGSVLKLRCAVPGVREPNVRIA